MMAPIFPVLILGAGHMAQRIAQMLQQDVRFGCVSNVVEILWRRSPSGLICT